MAFRTLFFLALIVIAAEALRGKRNRHNSEGALDCEVPEQRFTEECLEYTCANPYHKSRGPCAVLCSKSHNQQKPVCNCRLVDNSNIASWCDHGQLVKGGKH